MVKRFVTGAALAAAVVWSAVWSVSAQDAQTVIANVSKAMGVDALKTVQYSATGFDFALGQAPNPSSPWPKFVNKSYTRAINFETPASKVDRVRMQGENPPRGGGQQPIVGEQPQSQTIIVGADTPWAQQLEIWMLPQGFLRAAAKRNPTVEAKTIGGKKFNVVSFMGDNKAKVNGYINAQGQVERIETWIDHPVAGDMLYETILSGYKTVDGVQVPMHILQNQGGWPIFDLTLNDVKVNPPVSIQAAAPGGGGGGGGGAAATPNEKIADGIYLFNSGYAMMAIDLGDHILMLESGNSEARALAVIAETKKLIPGKPIRYVVNTHSHFDHSGGLRAFVAEGATIVTHEMNRAYVETLMKLPHTLNPDSQERAKQPVRVESMPEKRVFEGGGRTVELHHMTEFGHHPGMVMAYFPKEKILYEADGYNPGPANAAPPATPSPYNESLAKNIERLKLDVARIIPVHYPADGRVVTVDELNRMIGKQTSDK
jgi:glyoxylase-like metal-dependent hydrolase (beta-lactamase superfamily II)